MLPASLTSILPDSFLEVLKKEKIEQLRPSQKKAIDAGLLEKKNLIVCTPTASGKTLIAELAMLSSVLKEGKKAIYIVPLRSLATEKHKEFQRKYSHLITTALSIGDLDSDEPELEQVDIIICTAEKLDSLLRHRVSWIQQVGVLIFDEIHLLHDEHRGPVLEILITLLKTLLPTVQLIGLSATIGNPGQLADWLTAELVLDDWRPVPLHKGVYFNNTLDFPKRKERKLP